MVAWSCYRKIKSCEVESGFTDESRTMRLAGLRVFRRIEYKWLSSRKNANIRTSDAYRMHRIRVEYGGDRHEAAGVVELGTLMKLIWKLNHEDES